MMARGDLVAGLFLLAAQGVACFTPYTPTAGYLYALEAARPEVWPACPYRFLSHDVDCAVVDLWSGIGSNQIFAAVPASSPGAFSLQAASCGTLPYLTASVDCDALTLSFSATADASQEFRFVAVGDQFEYYVEAVARGGCDARYLSFSAACSADASADASTDSAPRPSLTAARQAAGDHLRGGARSSNISNTSTLRGCAYDATCSVSGIEGVCVSVSVSEGCCAGTATPGFCPGSDDVQCCTGASCATPIGDGACVQSAACGGISVPGYCDGPSGLQCCVGAGGGDSLILSADTSTYQRFRIHPIASPAPIAYTAATDIGCADPFVWRPREGGSYYGACTGGALPLASSPTLQNSSVFAFEGGTLGGDPAPWAADGDNRWAPENFETPDGLENFLVFCDRQPDGNHRIGWARSDGGTVPGAWTGYSPSYLDLGGAPGGDIDPHVFEDDDGSTYLAWKTDDNNAGDAVTRLWLQRVAVGNGTVVQLGPPTVILDSTGLWWSDSWVAGGSLIEGPEIVKDGGYWYLFFASGKFCQDSYMEGVARSRTSVFGPYEKMGVPLLTTEIVGTLNGEKLIGPGHASFLRDSADTGEWRAVWHASTSSEECDRFPFVSRLVFGSDGWPYIDI